MSSMFNDDSIDFCFLPKDLHKKLDPQIDRDLYREFSEKPHQFIENGIKFISKLEGFLCILCNEKLIDMASVNLHIKRFHYDLNYLLRKTPLRPVVGLDQICQYENESGPVEYKCNLCNVVFADIQIVWHVLSYLHKEEFFKTKLSIELLNKIQDPKLKHEKVDMVLMDFDKNISDRGQFQRKRFEKWMNGSNKKWHYTKVNLNFMKDSYTDATRKIGNITTDFESMKNIQNNLNFHINNEEDFAKGKELLQKINQALLQYNAE